MAPAEIFEYCPDRARVCRSGLRESYRFHAIARFQIDRTVAGDHRAAGLVDDPRGSGAMGESNHPETRMRCPGLRVLENWRSVEIGRDSSGLGDSTLRMRPLSGTSSATPMNWRYR